MKIEFRPTGDPDFIGFIQRNYVVQVLIDGESVAALTFRDDPSNGYEIWQRGGENKVRVRGSAVSSRDGSMISWGEYIRTSDGWLVLWDVELAVLNPEVPGEELFRLPPFASYKGGGGLEIPEATIVGVEENLLRLLYNLFIALTTKTAKRSLNLHVEKLDVAAGDHCLSTDEVPRDGTWIVTSITATMTCSGVTQVSLSRNYMNNMFKIRQEQSPDANELITENGMWILTGGEFMQTCFEDVPEGCDLHLYINGSSWTQSDLLELLDLQLLPAGKMRNFMAMGLPWWPVVMGATPGVKTATIYVDSTGCANETAGDANLIGAPNATYVNIDNTITGQYERIIPCFTIVVYHNSEGDNCKIEAGDKIDCTDAGITWTEVTNQALPSGAMSLTYSGSVGCVRITARTGGGGTQTDIYIDAVELFYLK